MTGPLDEARRAAGAYVERLICTELFQEIRSRTDPETRRILLPLLQTAYIEGTRWRNRHRLEAAERAKPSAKVVQYRKDSLEAMKASEPRDVTPSRNHPWIKGPLTGVGGPGSPPPDTMERP